MNENEKMGKSTLSSMILFGIVGYIAWGIENIFLNLYVYRTITTKLTYVSGMVAASAIVATLATIIAGWYSDRIGKRRQIMVYGYMIWGVTVILFSVFSVKNMQSIFGVDHETAITLAGVGMIITDCVMTFFGSSSNDAAFSAWVTDNTNNTNRGRVEAMMTILASVATVILFVPEIFGMTTNKYYDAAGNQVSVAAESVTTVTGNWTLFFCLLGGLTILAGFVGLFIVKDKPALQPNKSLAFKDLFYGFMPSVAKRNKYLYLMMATISISSIANNCFGNYLAIYMENTLECARYVPFLGYMLPMGVIYGLGAVTSIVIGIKLDKHRKKTTFLVPGIIISSIGAMLMFFFSPWFMEIGGVMLFLFCVGAFVQAVGSSMISVICLSSIRNLMPRNKVGQFQGIRMVFVVMLPMCIGSMITAIVSSSERYVIDYDEFGHAIYTCPPIMFLLTAIIVLLALFLVKPILNAKDDDLLIPAEGNSESADEVSLDDSSIDTAAELA